MRRRSLRLGITTLLSATLLGGATPAVAYEVQRDSATSLRIILDSGEKIEQGNAAAAILAIATPVSYNHLTLPTKRIVII